MTGWPGIEEETFPGALAPAPARARGGRWIAAGVTCAILGVLSLTFGSQIPLLGAADLGIHELGHLLAYPLGSDAFAAFAGSFLQVAAPLGLAAYFGLARREGWAAAPLVAWGATSLRNVAVYVADAPYLRLPLLGGEGVTHDWQYLLSLMRAVPAAEGIATVLHAIAFVMLGCAVSACAWGWYAERAASADADAREAGARKAAEWRERRG